MPSVVFFASDAREALSAQREQRASTQFTPLMPLLPHYFRHAATPDYFRH